MATPHQSNHAVVEHFYQHREKLFRFIRSRVSNAEDAEDLMQEVCLRLLEHPHEILPQGMSHLAFSIARHTLNDFLRHTYMKSAVHSRISLSVETISNETEDNIVGNDLRRLERRRLSAMSPQRRLIYRLRIHEGKTTREIAQSLQISPRTAENHFYIGIRQMREYFINAM